MNQFYEVHVVSSPGKSLEEVKEREGVEIHEVSMTRTISPWKDLISLIKLIKIIRKLRPAIIHSHTPKAGTLGMIAAKISGVPVRMHTVAGLPLLETGGNKRRLLGFIEKITYSCATMVYPNSFALKDIILQNKFCKREKLFVIGNGSSNGIDVSFFDPVQLTGESRQTLRNELHIKASDKIFCFIGRIVKDKGIQELVEAFCRMKKENASVKLLLVGSPERHLDPLSKETEDLISAEPDILFVGFQKDVRPYLAICDVFVFPSYREGFPNVVMQAGAMGVPCIVSNINGCNEIVEHKKNGWIVQAKNVDELNDAMVYLVENEAERKRMAELSRQMIVSRYKQGFLWEQLLIEYRKQTDRN